MPALILDPLIELGKAFARKYPKAARQLAPTLGKAGIRYDAYADDPVGYAENILGIEFLWDVQKEIMRALLEPPYRVLVRSAHNLGKTFLAALATNWFFDSFPDGIAITTAPTAKDVKDLLWKEIRLQRRRANLPDYFIGPSAPEMRTGPDHYAQGYTAEKGESFQGRHDAKMLFVFDEATGVAPIYWTTTHTMFKPERGHAWLAILNPTDTTAQAYLEERSLDSDGNPKWRTFSMSALDHPNIIAESAGRTPPIPNAVSCSQVDTWVTDWCEAIGQHEEKLGTDFEWPFSSGKFWRPGGQMEARGLGLWPSQGTYGVWSDALWRLASEGDRDKRIIVPLDAIPEIGCDVARFGDDFTAIHVRWGNTSFHHESANGWKITQTVGAVIELARFWTDRCNTLRESRKAAPIKVEDIPIKIDDDGLGGGCTDLLQEQGFNVVPVRSLNPAYELSRYTERRSELWFQAADKARHSLLWLGELDRDTLRKLELQLMAPKWKMASAGRRQVEKKDDTKKKIGRSPDDADAMNLAYLEGWQFEAPATLPAQEWQRPQPGREASRASKRGLFGRSK